MESTLACSKSTNQRPSCQRWKCLPLSPSQSAYSLASHHVKLPRLPLTGCLCVLGILVWCSHRISDPASLLPGANQLRLYQLSVLGRLVPIHLEAWGILLLGREAGSECG